MEDIESVCENEKLTKRSNQPQKFTKSKLSLKHLLKQMLIKSIFYHLTIFSEKTVVKKPMKYPTDS